MEETKELTGALIEEKLTRGLVYRGVSQDANLCTSFGIWSLLSTAENIPSGTFRNVLVCLPYLANISSSQHTLTQILFTHSTSAPKIYRRVMNDTIWKDWVLLH